MYNIPYNDTYKDRHNSRNIKINTSPKEDLSLKT